MMGFPAWSTCVAAVALTACSADAPGEQAGRDASPEPAETATSEGDAGAALPPEGEMFRFVGRWASSVEMCREQAWTITSDRLTAPEGAACDFTRIEKSPGGYVIDARCTIDGETQDDHIVLRFAESAQALLVEGAETLPETGLIHCEEN